MRSHGLSIVALTLAALGLVPGGAHLLELPARLEYPPELYATVTRTLYRGYGLVGGSVQVAAALAVSALALLERRRFDRRRFAAAAAARGVSLLLWGALVAPVNVAWGRVQDAAPEVVLDAYARLRMRWEYGHVAAFIAWFTGWIGLVVATEAARSRAEGR